jgi:hypothetical protein
MNIAAAHIGGFRSARYRVQLFAAFGRQIPMLLHCTGCPFCCGHVVGSPGVHVCEHTWMPACWNSWHDPEVHCVASVHGS